MALAALAKGDAKTAETSFRTAIRHQPDLAEAQNNLGNLLAGSETLAELCLQFVSSERIGKKTGIKERLTYQFRKCQGS